MNASWLLQVLVLVVVLSDATHDTECLCLIQQSHLRIVFLEPHSTQSLPSVRLILCPFPVCCVWVSPCLLVPSLSPLSPFSPAFLNTAAQGAKAVNLNVALYKVCVCVFYL